MTVENSTHPLDRALPKRWKAQLSTQRIRAFTEAGRQVKYSIIAVAAVILGEFFTKIAVDYVNFNRQIHVTADEHKRQLISAQIDKETVLIQEIVSEFRSTEEALAAMLRKLPPRNRTEALSNGAEFVRSIPEKRRQLMSLYAKVAPVLSISDANTIIDLTPETSIVDHSERFDCSQDYLKKLDDHPSMYFSYYSAACMAGTTSAADMFKKEDEVAIEEYQKKNIDVVISHVERFEVASANIEHKLLSHIEDLRHILHTMP